VQASAAEFERMGAAVTALRYPGRPHTVSGQELELARALLEQAFLATRSQP
jgi:hypothetical protein